MESCGIFAAGTFCASSDMIINIHSKNIKRMIKQGGSKWKFVTAQIREMSGDLAAGMSFVEAYQKRQLQEKESALESLRRQLEAEKKNNQNRASSPGSQSDAGSPKTSNAFDEFIGAFNT